MASHPKPSAKNESGEFARFKSFMGRLVAVPHAKIKKKLDAERNAKKRRLKLRSASRAANVKS
jgi:hypothetical protein